MDVLQPIFFLLVVIAIFPIAVGTDTQQLQSLAPGIIWVAVLLSVLLSAEKLYQSDYHDGSLTQYSLSGNSQLLAVLAKFIVQWSVQILPILLTLPLLGLWYHLSLTIMLSIAMTLIIGSPTLLLLAMLGAAITLSVSRAGLLLVILILPFYLPTLIFALSAIHAVTEGFSNVGQLSIMAAILLLMLSVVPFAIILALKVSLSQQ